MELNYHAKIIQNSKWSHIIYDDTHPPHVPTTHEPVVVITTKDWGMGRGLGIRTLKIESNW